MTDWSIQGEDHDPSYKINHELYIILICIAYETPLCPEEVNFHS